MKGPFDCRDWPWGFRGALYHERGTCDKSVVGMCAPAPGWAACKFALYIACTIARKYNNMHVQFEAGSCALRMLHDESGLYLSHASAAISPHFLTSCTIQNMRVQLDPLWLKHEGKGHGKARCAVKISFFFDSPDVPLH